jgi:hypothetical protein
MYCLCVNYAEATLHIPDFPLGDMYMASTEQYAPANLQIVKFSPVLERETISCGEPAISLQSYTVPLVQWSTRLLPAMRDLGLIPRGVLM